jgi:hypothetical protein
MTALLDIGVTPAWVAAMERAVVAFATDMQKHVGSAAMRSGRLRRGCSDDGGPKTSIS